jgi:hypothetical protein
MQCSTHTETTANGTCSYSGKPFCGDCLIEMEGKNYGKPYLDRALADIRDRAGSKSHPNVYMNAGGAAAAAATGSPNIISAGLTHVPFYRKRWCIAIACATPILAPFAFLSAVTGPLYWNDDGQWRRVSGGGKTIYVIWSIFGTALLAAL